MLCGGASTRMGRDKALIQVGETTMVERVCAVLAAAGCDPVVLVGGDRSRLTAATGREVVADTWPGEGPLGGVIDAVRWFAARGAEAVVVAACDLPDLTVEAVHAVADGAAPRPSPSPSAVTRAWPAGRSARSASSRRCSASVCARCTRRSTPSAPATSPSTRRRCATSTGQTISPDPISTEFLVRDVHRNRCGNGRAVGGPHRVCGHHSWMRWDGATAVITGASRGIGRAVAVAAVERGARVGLVARSGEELAALRDRLGGPAVVSIAIADLTDAAQLEQAFATVDGELGGVDVLVNNAGIGSWGPFVDTPDGDARPGRRPQPRRRDAADPTRVARHDPSPPRPHRQHRLGGRPPRRPVRGGLLGVEVRPDRLHRSARRRAPRRSASACRWSIPGRWRRRSPARAAAHRAVRWPRPRRAGTSRGSGRSRSSKTAGLERVVPRWLRLAHALRTIAPVTYTSGRAAAVADQLAAFERRWTSDAGG